MKISGAWIIAAQYKGDLGSGFGQRIGLLATEYTLKEKYGQDLL